MVFTPTRGDAPARFGPDVPMTLDIGTGILDASVYTDPKRYQRERTAVLAPSWQVICRSAEIANPGDFLTWAGQGETIVLTRRRDGGVSGFHNVCQHRGARIVSEPSGCARRFSCRWHNWVYDLQGAVVGVPDDVRGEIPIAYIVADDALDAAEIEEVCRAQLASFKIPRAFVRVESLPRTALGKVQKHLLPPWTGATR